MLFFSMTRRKDIFVGHRWKEKERDKESTEWDKIQESYCAPISPFYLLIGILPVGTVRIKHHDPAGMDNLVSCNPTCSFNGTSRRAGPRFYALMRGEGLPTPVRKNSPDRRESL